MRYVILGAGAVGGAIGFLLARAGIQVVLVARGAHGDAIRWAGAGVCRPLALVAGVRDGRQQVP